VASRSSGSPTGACPSGSRDNLLGNISPQDEAISSNSGVFNQFPLLGSHALELQPIKSERKPLAGMLCRNRGWVNQHEQESRGRLPKSVARIVFLSLGTIGQIGFATSRNQMIPISPEFQILTVSTSKRAGQRATKSGRVSLQLRVLRFSSFRTGMSGSASFQRVRKSL
jgi:hypothetical protein